MAIVLYVESGTIPSHPDYLSVKIAKNDKLFTILEKSNMTNEGYPIWKTPDNKTMKIYVKNVELPGYNIKVNNWILDLNHEKQIITIEAPFSDARYSPEMVDNWKTLHPFKFEQLEEKKYRDMFPKSTQQTQKAITTHPDYITYISTQDSRLLTILKKSNMLKNGYPEWTTPDKTITIYMSSIKIPGYYIKMNKWIISENYSIRAYAPVPHPILPPHLLSNWGPSATFRLEQLEEKKFLEMFPESKRPTNKAITSHPEFLSIKMGQTSAVLKKSTVNSNGYPIWKTPDNKTMQIYVMSNKLLGYNTKLNKLIFKADFLFQAHVPDPIPSPQSVTNWKSFELNTWVPTAELRVEQSNEMEYQNTYKADHSKVKSLPVQPADLIAGPAFLQFKNMQNGKIVTIMKKSDTLKNEASIFDMTRDKIPVWKLMMNTTKDVDYLLAHVTGTNRYPHTVQWRSWVKPEEKWMENILFSVEELNEEKYNELMNSRLRAAEQQEQKHELQQGVLFENAKSLIFGKTSLFPQMAVGAVLSESGIIGGVGGMGSAVLKEVGGIGSNTLDGLGQSTGELFSLPEKGIDTALSMLGLETPGIRIDSHITAVGTGVNSVSQGVASGLSELTDGLVDGSTHFTNSLDNFFSGDISSSIGDLAAGSNSIVGAGLGGIISVGDGIIDGFENTADDMLGGIGLDSSDFGIDIGMDFLGAGVHSVGQGLENGVSKIIQGFGDGSKNIVGGLEDGSQKIVSSFGHVFKGDVSRGIGDLNHGAMDILGGGVKGISSVGNNVFDGLGDTAGGLFESSVGNILSSQHGISKIKDFGENSVKKVTNTVTNSVSKVLDIFDW